MFLAPVLSRTSLSASIAVHAGIPVAPVIRSQSRTSRSKPSHPDEVPFQAITLTLACASSSAAARISVSSNCASAGPDSAISVTLKREKCAVTSGSPAIIAVVTGSRVVLEDGVSIPRKTRSVIDNSVCRARAHSREAANGPAWHILCSKELQQESLSGSAANLPRPVCNSPKEVADWRGSGRPRREQGDRVMDRRTFLRVTAGAGALMTTGGVLAPAVAQGAAKTLRFVPQANLANFDPIWGTQYVVRNAAVLVWDTLYGFDEQLQPQRQMIESEETSSDGLTWTFKLRAGLKFHDGDPVLAKDCVASLIRWSVRDPMGLMLKGIQQELTAVDDRTFKWVLKKPYPKMLLALAKNSTPMAFIMPERVAKTDPFKQIEEYVGSGPMKFAKAEWVPGAKAVFEKFADYKPRDEKASWLAGGKNMLIDRIE